MRCVVCGKEFFDKACPACQFPVIKFPGDPTEGMRAMKPKIDAYRDNFLAHVSVGIVTYTWKDGDGAIVLDKENELYFGTGAQLDQGECWISQKFARTPDVKNLDVQLVVYNNGNRTVRKMSLPNLFETELQEIGAALDEDLNIQLLLRNDSAQTKSNKEPLFL